MQVTRVGLSWTPSLANGRNDEQRGNCHSASDIRRNRYFFFKFYFGFFFCYLRFIQCVTLFLCRWHLATWWNCHYFPLTCVIQTEWGPMRVRWIGSNSSSQTTASRKIGWRSGIVLCFHHFFLPPLPLCYLYPVDWFFFSFFVWFNSRHNCAFIHIFQFDVCPLFIGVSSSPKWKSHPAVERMRQVSQCAQEVGKRKRKNESIRTTRRELFFDFSKAFLQKKGQ